jgi:PPP family 3-phenylpropionic acid transporter
MSVAPRLALFYAAVFVLVGIQLPFWPLWLAGRGLSVSEIGVVLAAALWIKVIVNPLAGLLADRTGRARGVIILLAVTNLAGFLLFVPSYGLWPLLLINALTTTAASSLMPLGETIALAIVYERRLDYGRIRLWGSISFIAGSLGAGLMIARATSEIVLPLLIGAAALNLVACAGLPAPPVKRSRLMRAGVRRLLLDRRQLLFLLAAAAIQGSHSVYYGFGTLHWTALGYSGETIGWLWAEGVIAEIVLFAYGAPLLARLGPARLLVLAGGAGALRWSLMAGAVSLPLLLAVQLLHALTFGAAHLGAMHFMARALPEEWSSTGQSLYSATVSGIGFGLVMAISGQLYSGLGANSYLVMAGIAAVGALAGIMLDRRWHGERLTT